jgi:hypothetical protein
MGLCELDNDTEEFLPVIVLSHCFALIPFTSMLSSGGLLTGAWNFD